MVGVKHIEETCICKLKQGANQRNCSYCKTFAEEMTLGEINANYPKLKELI